MVAMGEGSWEVHHRWWHHVLVGLVGAVKYSILLLFWFGVGYVGYLLYRSLPSPFSIILGVSGILLGGTLFLASLYELVIRFVSFRYTRSHCFICRFKAEGKYPLSF